MLKKKKKILTRKRRTIKRKNYLKLNQKQSDWTKGQEQPFEKNLVLAIRHFSKYITREFADTEYYFREVKRNLALSIKNQNLAMVQMLVSLVYSNNDPSTTSRWTHRNLGQITPSRPPSTRALTAFVLFSRNSKIVKENQNAIGVEFRRMSSYGSQRYDLMHTF